jgi:hypothetical protein
MGDAEIERLLQNGFTLLARWRYAIGVRQVHATKANFVDFERTKFSHF